MLVIILASGSVETWQAAALERIQQVRAGATIQARVARALLVVILAVRPVETRHTGAVVGCVGDLCARPTVLTRTGIAGQSAFHRHGEKCQAQAQCDSCKSHSCRKVAKKKHETLLAPLHPAPALTPTTGGEAGGADQTI